MRHAKKVVSLVAVSTVLLLFVLPVLVVPTDAAAVLETSSARCTTVGDKFSIRAVGQTRTQNDDDGLARTLTDMSLVFELVQRGRRGVRFNVLSGSFTMNTTHFSIGEGFGAAGIPDEGKLEGKRVFGFRFNMSAPDGTTAQVAFLGEVIRDTDSRPVLLMRGKITIGDVSHLLGQRGSISRI